MKAVFLKSCMSVEELRKALDALPGETHVIPIGDNVNCEVCETVAAANVKSESALTMVSTR
jgi:hypothetical protein